MATDTVLSQYVSNQPLQVLIVDDSIFNGSRKERQISTVKMMYMPNVQEADLVIYVNKEGAAKTIKDNSGRVRVTQITNVPK
jgi:hypothetical protein